MPKHSKPNKLQKQSFRPDIVVKGHVIYQATQSVLKPMVFSASPSSPFFPLNGVVSTNVYGGNKLADVNILYQFFRFTSLRIRIMDSSVGFAQIAYYPSVTRPTSYPTTFDQMTDAPFTSQVSLFDSSYTTPSVTRWFKIPLAALTNQPVEWWNTTPYTTIPAELASQGMFVVGNSSTGAVTSFEVDYVCEFRNFVNPNTLDVADVREEKEPLSVASKEDWTVEPAPLTRTENRLLRARLHNLVKDKSSCLKPP